MYGIAVQSRPPVQSILGQVSECKYVWDGLRSFYKSISTPGNGVLICWASMTHGARRVMLAERTTAACQKDHRVATDIVILESNQFPSLTSEASSGLSFTLHRMASAEVKSTVVLHNISLLRALANHGRPLQECSYQGTNTPSKLWNPPMIANFGQPRSSSYTSV